MIPQLSFYWDGGLSTKETNPLNTIPDGPKYVILFLANCTKEGINYDYLTRYYDLKTIITQTAELRKRNIKVLLSLLDRDTLGWNQVHPKPFAKALVCALQHLGIDGFDFDGDGIYTDCFREIIPAFRQASQELDWRPIVSLTCYTGSQLDLMRDLRDQINFVQTMNYGPNARSIIAYAEQCANQVGKQNVFIGINIMSCTQDEAHESCDFTKEQSFGGIMAFTVERDIEHYTGKPRWFWVQELKRLTLPQEFPEAQVS